MAFLSVLCASVVKSFMAEYVERMSPILTSPLKIARVLGVANWHISAGLVIISLSEFQRRLDEKGGLVEGESPE